jgi:hypothetical protein
VNPQGHATAFVGERIERSARGGCKSASDRPQACPHTDVKRREIPASGRVRDRLSAPPKSSADHDCVLERRPAHARRHSAAAPQPSLRCTKLHAAQRCRRAYRIERRHRLPRHHDAATDSLIDSQRNTFANLQRRGTAFAPPVVRRDAMHQISRWTFVLSTLFVFATSPLHAQSLAWDANQEIDLAGYKVFIGTQSGTYGAPIDVGNVTTYRPAGVDWTRRMYFAVKAYNTSGMESPFSTEAVWTPASLTRITSVTSNVASPIMVGTPITWTATGSNNLGPVEYKFYICKKGTTWVLGRDWGTANTFTWTPQPADAGTPNYIQVWVRAVGSTAAYEAYLGFGPFDIVQAPLWLTSNVDFPTPPGNQVTFTATLGTPPTGPVEYKFQVVDLGTNTTTLLRDYSSSNKVQWTPPAAGRYALQGLARAVGSPAPFDVSGSTQPLDVSATPVVIKSFTASTAFPSTTGTPITFTVRVQGGMAGPLQYVFWLYSATSGWRNGQPWGASETFTWTPTWADQGDFAVQVWVRSNGSTANYEAVLGTPIFHINRASLQLTTNTLFPAAVGTPITWNADVRDPSVNMEYVFWVYTAATNSWSQGQAYSAQKTFVWQAPATATYAVQVWARQVGSTVAHEMVLSSGMFDVVSAPAQMVSLTSNAPLPAIAGTTITWTAGATGGTAPLEYQFWRQDAGTWTMVQDYSPLNTYTWPTTAADSGQHAVQARVRSIGSTSPYEAQMTSGAFQIN